MRSFINYKCCHISCYLTQQTALKAYVLNILKEGLEGATFLDYLYTLK